jgi:hypothetical protein
MSAGLPQSVRETSMSSYTTSQRTIRNPSDGGASSPADEDPDRIRGASNRAGLRALGDHTADPSRAGRRLVIRPTLQFARRIFVLDRPRVRPISPARGISPAVVVEVAVEVDEAADWTLSS